MKKYSDMGDTILMQQTAAKQNFDFNENFVTNETQIDKNLKFPFLFFNILIVLSILIIGFVFKFKR